MVEPGTPVLKNLIDSYKKKKITMIYGPGASGKTTCCYLCSIQCAKTRSSVIYIDTENGFNSERFSQLAGEKCADFLKNIFLFRINDFNEQIKIFKKLKKFCSNDKLQVIIVDTIGNHYRRELKKDYKKANREIMIQMKILEEIASENNKIILLTNQVYQNIEKQNEITLVGGNMMKCTGDCLIELKKTHDNDRFAVLRKDYDSDDPLEKKVKFEIREKGIFQT
ncbi:AAA family ATPase [Candidatus Woesearchaeota archaeon]|nr:AAA family ATPase [Candidatus Woesearchaeota archaeon]